MLLRFQHELDQLLTAMDAAAQPAAQQQQQQQSQASRAQSQQQRSHPRDDADDLRLSIDAADVESHTFQPSRTHAHAHAPAFDDSTLIDLYDVDILPDAWHANSDKENEHTPQQQTQQQTHTAAATVPKPRARHPARAFMDEDDLLNDSIDVPVSRPSRAVTGHVNRRRSATAAAPRARATSVTRPAARR